MTLRTAARGRPRLQWKMRLLSSLPLNKLMEQLWGNLIRSRCDGESTVLSRTCCVGLEPSNSPFGVVPEQPHLAMNAAPLLSWRTPELGPLTHQGSGTQPFPSLSSPASSDYHFLLLRSDFQLPRAPTGILCLSFCSWLLALNVMSSIISTHVAENH